MHLQTLSWARLTKAQRDSRLRGFGLTTDELQCVGSRGPRERILEAARLAFKIDDEPNADLIDFIAGYDARGGLYHYFRTVEDLLGSITSRAKLTSLPRVELEPGEIDLAEIIPQTIGEYPVHVESGNRSWRFLVWQKVNGGMRSIMLKRVVPRISFLAGVLLYAGEGTKSAASGEVEISNSSANILRLFIGFLGTLGVPPERLKARIQIHEPIEESTARSQWVEELGLRSEQFTKPLISASKGRVQRRTYSLQLSYADTMLLMLLRVWTTNLEDIVRLMGSARQQFPQPALLMRRRYHLS